METPSCTECDVIIVGAGAAGLTAALYAQRYGLNATVLEKLAPGGQLTLANSIENYPGFPDGVSGLELIDLFRKHAENFGAVIEQDTISKVERSEQEDRWRLTGAKRDYISDAVIVATGARHRGLNCPGEKEFAGKGVSVCAVCDGFFYRGAEVAVVGGGNVAIDDAIYLSDLAKKVTVIHRRDELRADPILRDRAFARENIEFAWDSVVASINGDDDVESVTVKNVKTEELSDIAVTGVFVAIGFIPEVALVDGIVDTEDGHIRTDGHMKTSAPGIFACGDIRKAALKQIATAVGDGAIAADSAYKYVQARR